MRRIIGCLALLSMGWGASASVFAATAAHWLGGVHFPAGSTGSLTLHDGHAYVLNGWTRGDGILVFDIRNPREPRFVKGLPAKGYLRPGLVRENQFYIPANMFSLMVVDVGDASQARIARNLSFNFPVGDMQCLAGAGNRLYQGGRGGGLRILDISEPGTPVIAAHYPRYGNLAGILAGDDGLLVLRPQRGETVVATVKDDLVTEHARIKTGRNPRLVGKALYDTTSRECIVRSLADPANPEIVTRLPGLVPLCPAGPNRLLARDASQTLVWLDVSNPLAPQTLRTVRLPENVSMGSVAWHDDRLVFVDRERISLRLLDVSTDIATELGEAFIMRNAGNLALGEDGVAFLSYVQGVNSTVFTVDASHNGPLSFHVRHTQPAASPSDTFTLHDTHRAAAVARHGKYLLTGDGLLDVSNPARPVTLHPLQRVAASISIRGNLAALAQGDRVAFVDLGRLPDYVVAGTYRPEEESAHLTDVALGDGIACLVNNAKGQARIEILDIGNPARPHLLGQCEVPMAIVAALSGNLLYVPGAKSGGLTIVDVADPARPRVVGTRDGLLDSSCYRVKVHGSRLFYTDSMRGIKVADLADPLHPVLLHTYYGDTTTSANYTDFVLRGNRLHGLRFSCLDVWQIED